MNRAPSPGHIPLPVSSCAIQEKLIRFLRSDDTRDQESPEPPRSPRGGHPFVEPAQVLSAMSAEGHAPRISRKPAVLLGRLSKGYRALARRKSVKIAFHSCRIDKKMSAGPSKNEKAVGMRDQAATGAALKRLGSVPPGSVGRVMVHAPSFAQNQNLTVLTSPSNSLISSGVGFLLKRLCLTRTGIFRLRARATASLGRLSTVNSVPSPLKNTLAW